jgi:hypothetical protein
VILGLILIFVVVLFLWQTMMKMGRSERCARPRFAGKILDVPPYPGWP